MSMSINFGAIYFLKCGSQLAIAD